MTAPIVQKPIIIVGDNPATAVNEGGNIAINDNGTVTVTGKIPMNKIREGLAEQGYTLGELVSTHGKQRVFSVTTASAAPVPADSTAAANPVDTATISPAASNPTPAPAPETPAAPPAASGIAHPDQSGQANAQPQVGPSPAALFSDSLHGYHNPGVHNLYLAAGLYRISVSQGRATVQIQSSNGNWYNADQATYEQVQGLVNQYGLTSYPSATLQVIGGN